jgi:ankyrin repeat protein
MSINFTELPMMFTRHMYHKLTLIGLSLGFLFSPYTVLRFFLGLGIVTALVNLFRTETREQNFFEAIENHQLDRFKKLLREHPELAGARNNMGYPAITLSIQACDSNNPDSEQIFKSILTHGMDLHTRDQEFGRTALHWAYNQDNAAIITQLGEQDLDVLDYDGCTPTQLQGNNSPHSIYI